MRIFLLLAIFASLLVGCGAKPDVSVEARSEKENAAMKEAGGDE